MFGMPNRSFLLAIMLLLGLSARSSAYLGDSGETIDDNYGYVQARHLNDDGTISFIYHNDHYYIHVVIDHGRSVLEKYWRADGHDLSKREIDRFFKANGGGDLKWEPRAAGEFVRSDHKAEALVEKDDGKVTLTVHRLRGH
jgi:hypothetical protein